MNSGTVDPMLLIQMDILPIQCIQKYQNIHRLIVLNKKGHEK